MSHESRNGPTRRIAHDSTAIEADRLIIAPPGDRAADRRPGDGRGGAPRLDSRLAARVRRGMVEAALRGVLIGYSGLVLAAVIGTPLTVWLASRSRRKGRIRPGILRGFAVCLVCLVSLVVLELGSAAWRGWMHRFPALPTTFEAIGARGIPDRGPGRLQCAGRAVSSLAVGRPDRRLAAPAGGPGPPVRVRDPGLARRLAGEAASQAGRPEAPPGRRDHLFGTQRIRGAVRGGARPLGRRGARQPAAPGRRIAPPWSLRSAGWPTR